MTDTAPRTRRALLPLAASSSTGTWQTCKWKCNYDCWHEPANTSANETFDTVVARALAPRLPAHNTRALRRRGRVHAERWDGRRDTRQDQPAPPVDPANPRPANAWGHVIEWFEDGDDAAATTFTWTLFLVCGDPEDPSTYFAGFPRDQVSPISCPDNVAFDNTGNVIIATDGQPGSLGVNDAFHFVPVSGDERGHVQQFLSVPVDAEASGPELTPDNYTLFCAVQHPGEDGSFESPTSTWPDGDAPPRPSLINIAKRRRGVIGS